MNTPGYTEDVTLSDFYSDLLSSTAQAHAILGGINSDNTHSANADEPHYDAEGSYKADETPIKSETKIENMGLAVFYDDKLVGELDGMESLCHLLLVNRLKSATLSIPNPFNSDSVISLFITPKKISSISVKFINGTPIINCNINITGYVLSLDEDLDYSKEENLKLVEEYANSYLEQNMLSYLYKTSKEFKSDIANLGNYALKNYLTWNEWVDSDWLGNYQNSFFKVTVNTKILSGQLFIKV